MGAWILTAVTVPFLGVAAYLSLRFGGLVRERTVAEPIVGDRPRLEQSARFLRAIAVSLTSGLVAGVAVGGVGGRYLMRLAAATSDDSVQGFLTDADERVGRITFGGSMFLVAFIGVLIMPVFGVAYRFVRRWLPSRTWVAGLCFAALPAAALGRVINFTNPLNKDFSILSPTPLIALMIVALIALYGVTLAATHEWLERRMPLLGRSPKSWATYLPLLVTFLNPFMGPAVALGTVMAGLAPRGFGEDLGRGEASGVVTRVLTAVASAAGLFVLSDLVRIAT